MEKLAIFSIDSDDIRRLEKDVNDFLRTIDNQHQPKIEWMQSSEERRTIITAIITYDNK